MGGGKRNEKREGNEDFARRAVPGQPEADQFGRIFQPDQAWLAKAAPEPILDPDLQVVDTHHHIWDLPRFRYLLDEFLADVDTGHNIVATVFNECRSMYRAKGPEEMKPVGEVEFGAGVGAMSASGTTVRLASAVGIVGHADLALGDRAAAVLEAEIAAGGGRFRGVRHSARLGRRPDHRQQPRREGAGAASRTEFRAGLHA